MKLKKNCNNTWKTVKNFNWFQPQVTYTYNELLFISSKLVILLGSSFLILVSLQNHAIPISKIDRAADSRFFLKRPLSSCLFISLKHNFIFFLATLIRLNKNIFNKNENSFAWWNLRGIRIINFHKKIMMLIFLIKTLLLHLKYSHINVSIYLSDLFFLFNTSLFFKFINQGS